MLRERAVLSRAISSEAGVIRQRVLPKRRRLRVGETPRRCKCAAERGGPERAGRAQAVPPVMAAAPPAGGGAASAALSALRNWLSTG